MSLFKKKLSVVTHDGSFHADEVFACATLELWVEQQGRKLNITRSRDPEIIKKGEIVVDVGMEYDPARGRFDHHQKGGSREHKNGIPYASFGLVWKHYGEQVCENKAVWEMVERILVVPVDAWDNGINIFSPNNLGILDHRTSNTISNFNLTWQEDLSKNNFQFEKAFNFAREILNREIAVAKAQIQGFKLTEEAILLQNNAEILVLDKYLDWESGVSKNKNVKLVVYKHKNDRDWAVQSGRDDLEDYNSDRANLPAAWWGLRGSELEEVSGVKGASFCTNGGWFATAKTREGAIKMAEIALQKSQN